MNMSQFTIKSCNSDISLVLSNIKDDYFDVHITSSTVNVIRTVYAYTNAYLFADLMEHLASFDTPWLEIETWGSLEGEFKFTATCDSLGHVTFNIDLRKFTGSEDWSVVIDIASEFGQLPQLAKAARSFFGESK